MKVEHIGDDRVVQSAASPPVSRWPLAARQRPRFVSALRRDRPHWRRPACTSACRYALTRAEFQHPQPRKPVAIEEPQRIHAQSDKLALSPPPPLSIELLMEGGRLDPVERELGFGPPRRTRRHDQPPQVVGPVGDSGT